MPVRLQDHSCCAVIKRPRGLYTVQTHIAHSTMALFLSPKKREGMAKAFRGTLHAYRRVVGDGLPFPHEFVAPDGSGVSVAADDRETASILEATARMSRLYHDALRSDPLQDKVKPWEAVLTAAEKRNGGVCGSVGGSGMQIVTDSRTDYHVAAASAAIAALQPRETWDLVSIIRSAVSASDLCPLDIDACVKVLMAQRAERELETACSTALSENSLEQCKHFGAAAAWGSTEVESNALYASLCMTHQTDIAAQLKKQAKAKEKELAELLRVA